MFQNPAPFSHPEEKAYRKRAKECHPDKGGNVEEFRALDIGIIQERSAYGCKSNYKVRNIHICLKDLSHNVAYLCSISPI
jgi:hypothetical protein